MKGEGSRLDFCVGSQAALNGMRDELLCSASPTPTLPLHGQLFNSPVLPGKAHERVVTSVERSQCVVKCKALP